MMNDGTTPRVQHHASLEQWWAGGTREALELPSGEFSVFTRHAGHGPKLCLLHGFPSSSWDWACLEQTLAQRCSVMSFDFLGFGNSDKPLRHDYSIFEQADLVEALWRNHDIAETDLVAHDYGTTVAMELVTRQRSGRLKTRIKRLILLNGGVYVHRQRPVLAQKLLRLPKVGAFLHWVLRERVFRRQFTSVFAPRYAPTPEELRQHWKAITAHRGIRVYHRIIRYLSERERYAAVWEESLENAGIPLCFVWGMLDPVSGRGVAEGIRERVPHATFRELPDVGHYPQLEAPERVLEAIFSFLAEDRAA